MTTANKQRRHRLVVLADFLETVVLPRLGGAKFDMTDWGHTKSFDTCTPNPIPIPSSIDKTSECGFQGCAIGWAYYCPKLIKAGIRNAFYGSKSSQVLYPVDSELARFFGVTFDYWSTGEFHKLFMPDSYSAKTGVRALKAVVKRLREVAAVKVER